MSDGARLRREIATRDAFLTRVSEELDLRVAALGKKCRGRDDLVSFARELGFIAGREHALSPRRKRLDLGDFAAKVISGMRRRLRKRLGKLPSIELSRTGDLRGRFDPDQLETIILELVSNGLKYGAGKPIRVELEGRGAQVRLSVLDQGPGLRSAPGIGRRFVRHAGARRGAGFGVGLWLTRRLAQAQGGTLRLSRRREGGTRAVVELPRSRRRAMA
jgi:signal transduction histidine kinase